MSAEDEDEEYVPMAMDKRLVSVGGIGFWHVLTDGRGHISADLFECGECSGLITDPEKHADFHKGVPRARSP